MCSFFGETEHLFEGMPSKNGRLSVAGIFLHGRLLIPMKGVLPGVLPPSMQVFSHLSGDSPPLQAPVPQVITYLNRRSHFPRE